ncbi:J domain-containing protein [bacterium]|nr:J domain-containing protein [bacterium]
MQKDTALYYKELGLQPKASKEEIRDAYRKLAKKYHPDLNGGDPRTEDRFKRINEAYHSLIGLEPLSEKELKTAETAARQRKKTKKDEPPVSFADILKKVFKTSPDEVPPPPAPSGPKPGKDIAINLELSLEELTNGTRKSVLLAREQTCRTCSGTGIEPGHDPQQCKICLGIGEVPTSQGGKTVFKTCTNCNGSGRIIKNRCVTCAGHGLARSKSKISITIPKGTTPDAVLTLRGLGDQGRKGAKNGDLKVRIICEENPYYDARGFDIYYEYPMNLLEIFDGGEIEVPTPSGKVKLTLTPGIEQNKLLRVKGRGLDKGAGEHGDLLVRVNYHFPNKLTKKARALLEQLVELPGWSPKRDSEGFIKKPD